MEHLYISIKGNKAFKSMAFSKEDRKINIILKSMIELRIDSIGKGIFVIYEAKKQDWEKPWQKIFSGNLEETIE
jgi:hypothetical protein